MKGVVDTMVVRKANAALTATPRSNRDFLKRIALLQAVSDGSLVPLFSDRLLQEYKSQIAEPRNDFVRIYLDLLIAKGQYNWHRPWTGARGRARKCRYPAEDDHVLRTAFLDGESALLYTEEGRQLGRASCVLREFNVEICDPTQ